MSTPILQARDVVKRYGRFTAVDGPTTVAYDGEVGEALSEASFTVRYRALPVFRPLP